MITAKPEGLRIYLLRDGAYVHVLSIFWVICGDGNLLHFRPEPAGKGTVGTVLASFLESYSKWSGTPDRWMDHQEERSGFGRHVEYW